MVANALLCRTMHAALLENLGSAMRVVEEFVSNKRGSEALLLGWVAYIGREICAWHWHRGAAQYISSHYQ